MTKRPERSRVNRARFSFEPLSRAWRNFDPVADDDPRSVWVSMAEIAQADEPQLSPPSHRSWNWLAKGLHPRVRNQNDWNACVSFSSIAMIEARRTLAGQPDFELSPGFVHNCLLGITDPTQVTNPTEVLNACVESGVAITYTTSLPVPASTCAISTRAAISGHYWNSNASAILDDLVDKGPAVVTMFVDGEFFKLTGSGTYSLAEGSPDAILHAVLLLGYDLGKGEITVLHSGGRDWGANGVGTVSIGSGGVINGRSSIGVNL